MSVEAYKSTALFKHHENNSFLCVFYDRVVRDTIVSTVVREYFRTYASRNIKHIIVVHLIYVALQRTLKKKIYFYFKTLWISVL